MDLKKFREEHKLTQKRFAKIIGVPRSTYQMWEYKNSRPNKENIEKIKIAIEIIKKHKKVSEQYEINQKIMENYHHEIDEFAEDSQCPKLIKFLFVLILIFIFTVLW